MGEVIRVQQWGNRGKCFDEARKKLLSCDRFIRSRFITPPMGNVIFNFPTGKVTICHECTCISGEDCEIVIRGEELQIIGEVDDAIALFCAIHREIESLNPHAMKMA